MKVFGTLGVTAAPKILTKTMLSSNREGRLRRRAPHTKAAAPSTNAQSQVKLASSAAGSLGTASAGTMGTPSAKSEPETAPNATSVRQRW